MTKQYYLIRPLSPLVFGNGKPFDAQSEASDIIFPLPSSGAGLIRSQYLQQNKLSLTQAQHHLKLSDADHQQLLNIEHIGPFLVEILADGGYNIFTAKPADALYLLNKESGKVELIRLSPQKMDENMGCDLPAGLLPVMMNSPIKGKPQSGAMFWRLEDSFAWQNGADCTYEEITQRGITSLPIDVRTHVAIDDDTLSSEEGRLFQSIAYDLDATRKENFEGWNDRSYGFLLLSDQELEDTLVKFGGEGRLSEMTKTESCPAFSLTEALMNKIQDSQGLKLTLLTPAIFAQGYLPGWIDQETLKGILPHTNIEVQLRSCSMDRWIPISGWDMQQHRPKAMRKAVASGAVYWFDVVQGDIKELQQLVLKSISDHERDQKDGFGLVNIAPWANI